MQNNIRKTAL